MMTISKKGWKQNQGSITRNPFSIRLGLERTLMLRRIRNKLIFTPVVGLQSLWRTPMNTLKNSTEFQARWKKEEGREGERERKGGRENGWNKFSLGHITKKLQDNKHK